LKKLIKDIQVPNPDPKRLKVEDIQKHVKVEVKMLPPHLKHVFFDEYHKNILWFRNGSIQNQ